jgi:hypothetical protein
LLKIADGVALRSSAASEDAEVLSGSDGTVTMLFDMIDQMLGASAD